MSALQIPTAEVFEPLLLPARYKGAHGGRGSGKSHFFAGLMVESAKLRPGFRGLCVREVQKSLRESSKRLIEDKIREYGLQNEFEVLEAEIRTPGGGVLTFQGMQNHTADSVKSFEGYDVAWWEEAHTASDKSLTLLRPTIRKPGSELWFSWNPTSKRDAVDILLRQKKPSGAVVVQANWRDNPWFPAELQAEMEDDRRQDPEKAAHVWDGEYQIVSQGAYFALQIITARREGRIRSVEADANVPVHTSWDLGIGDSTVVWLWQAIGSEIRVIDCISNHGQPLAWYVSELEGRGYRYGDDFLPHDARARELITGRTRVETMITLGRRPRIVPMHTVDDGINAAREILPRCLFDEKRCDEGIDALSQYRADYHDDLKTFLPRPLHDWTSHYADAFRYMAMAYREIRPQPKPVPKPQELRFEVNDAGQVVSNMSVRQIVEAKARARERDW